MTKENWWDGRLAGFDLETTSAEPEEARIVTGALALCGGGQPTSSRTWLADPGVEIPEEASALHGVTTERARDEGAPRSEVVAQILEELEEFVADGVPLVVFNARYDMTVMDREARRLGLRPLREDALIVDPLTCDKHLHRYRPGSRKLDAICRFRGAVLDGAHSADHDAIAAARLAWVIGAKGVVIRRVRDAREEAELQVLQNEWEAVRYDLGLLHEAQREWARQQASSLSDYFMERGEYQTAADVRTEWPVVPYSEPVAA